MVDLEKEFEKYEDEHLEFDREIKPLHPCPDVCALLLLHSLAPIAFGHDMICAAEHDEFFLATDLDKLAETATSENIRTLVRCGVRYSEDGLAMFA